MPAMMTMTMRVPLHHYLYHSDENLERGSFSDRIRTVTECITCWGFITKCYTLLINGMDHKNVRLTNDIICWVYTTYVRSNITHNTVKHYQWAFYHDTLDHWKQDSQNSNLANTPSQPHQHTYGPRIFDFMTWRALTISFCPPSISVRQIKNH